MSLNVGRLRPLNFSLAKLAASAVAALSLVFLSACNDAPTDIGYSLLNDTVNVGTIASTPDTLLIASTGTSLYFEELFNTGKMFIGAANGTKAAALIRFSKIPDSLADLKQSDIVSAKYLIYVDRYALGDTVAGKLNFDVKRINQPWTNLASWDSLSAAGFQGETVGSFDEKITYKDSGFIQIPIDAKLISDWTQRAGDTIPNNPGIALVPNSGASVINSFYSLGITSTPPPGENKLEIVYRRSDGSTATVKINAAIEKSVIKAPDYDPNMIEIMGAAVLYAKIDFDIPSNVVRPLSGIHKAELTLTTDLSQVKVGNFGMPKYLRGEYTDKFESASGNVPSFEGGWVSQDDYSQMRFPNIISAIERITRKGGKGSIIIRPFDFTNQYHRADKLVFFGANADWDKRPKLKIIYSTAPSIK